MRALSQRTDCIPFQLNDSLNVQSTNSDRFDRTEFLQSNIMLWKTKTRKIKKKLLIQFEHLSPYNSLDFVNIIPGKTSDEIGK